MKKIGLLSLLLILFCSYSYSQNPCPNLAALVYSGKTYTTVAIGDQCWLRENLDVGKRVDGFAGQSNNSLIEKFCFNDDSANCGIYGGLYLWDEAMQYVTTPGSQGICPTGWHIPTYAELQTLSTTVSNDGNTLKAVGQGITDPVQGWFGAGTNTSGFSAVLGGYEYYVGQFSNAGGWAYFWGSTDYVGAYAYMMRLDFDNNNISFSNPTKNLGFSVRCLNDLSVSALLPVELNLFTAVTDGRIVHLNWSTITEKNSDKFNIERKTIDAAWASIGSVKAAVLSNSPKQYSYTDKNLQSGKYQYRLKMIDNDGTFEYSKIVETEVAVPKNFELSQNFPNPFNPNTVITYSLPMASNVKLIVFNSLGQIVKVLENGFKNAGTYSVNFIASNLPSGIYYYKIEAGQFSQIKKMTLLK